jgi:HAD superfamily hydrolase (TIGR01549 family)
MKILAPDRLQSPPDVVLLDLDNTLYPYDPPNAAGLRAVEQKANDLLGVASGEFRSALGVAREGVKASLGPVAASHSRLLYFQSALEGLGLGSQVLMALDLEQTYWRAFLIEARLFDGARGFLDDLRLQGVPVVIVTDLTAQIQFRKLVAFEIDSYFDFVVTSEEAGVEKPDPRPFDIALEKLGYSSGTVWVIGDSATRDVGVIGSRPEFVPIQKLHAGVERAVGPLRPVATFTTFDALRRVLSGLFRATS